MADAGGGAILNLGASGPRPEGVSFVASKTGVVGLTQQTARELAQYHIRCNALILGAVGEEDMPAPQSALPGSLDDAASAALFLLSDASRFITGQTLTVDGGASLGL
jgi:3-oxoacyl-[acyl-carrier protein] reductase